MTKTAEYLAGYGYQWSADGLFPYASMGPAGITAKPDPSLSILRYQIRSLNDWIFEDPHRLMAKLKKISDYYNFIRRTVSDLFEDISQSGWNAILQRSREPRVSRRHRPRLYWVFAPGINGFHL